METFISIFTPTYNRGYILPLLYESLKQQTEYGFEWIVVDDGSTDNTEELVAKWIEENKLFGIEYYKKENGGKPRAINYGLKKAKGEFFFIVDSDDVLVSDAIEKMSIWCKEIENKPEFIGVGAARGKLNGQYIKGVSPIVNELGYVDCTNLERNKYHLDADMCEAYKVDVLKHFPMAEWKDEKFAPEQIGFNEAALAGYKLRWHKDIIYICEYRDDGLTKGSWNLEKQNPMGYSMMYNHMLRYPGYSKKQKYKFACQHIALAIVGKTPSYILKTYNKKYTVLALPVGCVLAIRRKIQFRKNS